MSQGIAEPTRSPPAKYLVMMKAILIPMATTVAMAEATAVDLTEGEVRQETVPTAAGLQSRNFNVVNG